MDSDGGGGREGLGLRSLCRTMIAMYLRRGYTELCRFDFAFSARISLLPNSASLANSPFSSCRRAGAKDTANLRFTVVFSPKRQNVVVGGIDQFQRGVDDMER